jgi:hypothetical protein
LHKLNVVRVPNGRICGICDLLLNVEIESIAMGDPVYLRWMECMFADEDAWNGRLFCSLDGGREGSQCS